MYKRQVQEYTPHLGAPIWPDETLSRPAAREQLRQKTEDFCRETYETEMCIRDRYSFTISGSEKDGTGGSVGSGAAGGGDSTKSTENAS